ncbi:PREDICTED: glutathione S-transferase U8 [Theobroma cacao]|uniref:glutathione transferase n=2 Tax=Theobroma cacao TaxID=3641 RepID=A0AB32V3B4_THECC|nr:PREDICTED: glutathione S-transferase U8 [Theobroma cacao]EOY07368.1 Tau class glutathione transferase GSTU45 [Theobroma cacao]
MAEEVKLFGAWGSPFSRRVEIALELKGIPFEYIEENVSDDKFKSPLLLKYNPIHKKVPVLLHNGKPVLESLIILEYVDETWKDNPILPEDPHERTMARFWARFIDEKCMPPVWKALLGTGEEREKALEEVRECLKTLEGVLNGKRFFGGETIGLLDIAANFIAFWLRVIQEVSGLEFLTADKCPVLIKWCDEFVSCNPVKEHLPPRDKLIAFMKNWLSGDGWTD